MEELFRVSSFCHFVNGTNGFTAMYNSITLGVVFVETAVAEFFHERQKNQTVFSASDAPAEKELLETLCEQQIVSVHTEDSDQKLYESVGAHVGCGGVGILYLLLTDNCNLRCKYCFVENRFPVGHQFSYMTIETARKGIDGFVQALHAGHRVEQPQIILYGGEPLLNLPVVTFVLEYVDRLKQDGALPANTLLTVNTNGTRITPESVSLFRRFDGLNIAISVDGPEDIHDSCRPTVGQGGSFERVMEGYRLLKEGGVQAGLCCTISNRNINNLEEIARWFVEEMEVKSIGFNILIDNLQMATTQGDPSEYAKLVSDKLIKCFVFFRDHGVHEDRMMRKVEAFVSGTVYYYDCGGCGQQMVISPDGRVGVCQAYFGTDKNFVPLDEHFDPNTHPLWKEWRSRSPLNMPQCKDCIALGLCGGGCPYNADMQEGSIWGLDEVFCVHAKDTTTFLIRDLLERTVRS